MNECYLCKLSIPHREQEHEEVLLGGLKAEHKGSYPGMSWKGVQHDRRAISGDLPREDRIKAYMKQGNSRALAVKKTNNVDRNRRSKEKHSANALSRSI